MAVETGATRILDLACGTGSLLVRLEAPGRAVTGLDLSREMLLQARKKGSGARLVQGCMTALPFRRPFDMILCLYDSMNYLLEESHLVAAFGEARRLLANGGLFLFDLNNRIAYEEVWAEGGIYEAEGEAGRLRIRSRYNKAIGLGEADVEVERREEGRSVVYASVHRQRHYPAAEVASHLRRAGFHRVRRERIDPFPEEESFALPAKDLYLAAAGRGKG
jgi:SAM-dependent methyltransferase